MFGPSFWRTQAFLLLRAFVGFPIAVALISLVGTALSLIFAPFWVPFVHGGARLGFWHPHTFLGSIPLVPVGLVMLPATLLLVNPLTAVFRPMVSGLLPGPAALPGATGTGATAAANQLATKPVSPAARRRALEMHAGVDGAVVSLLVLIWAVTSRGDFWPIWVVLPMALALGIHAWLYELWQRPALVRRVPRQQIAGAEPSGSASIFWLFTVAIWAVTATATSGRSGRCLRSGS